jgi:hypothetical protein
MSRIAHYFPAVSCVLAIAALPLALSAGTFSQVLQATLSLTGVALTISSLVLAISGIVVFRRGPRRQAVTAWIGLLLCGLPIAYWGFILYVILNMSSANPF